jgi:hypothetical protein
MLNGYCLLYSNFSKQENFPKTLSKAASATVDLVFIIFFPALVYLITLSL